MSGCGGGGAGCGCGQGGGVAEVLEQAEAPVLRDSLRVNGVPVSQAHEQLSDDEARQRAHTELLRQAAQRAGLLAASDVAQRDGSTSAQATQAIEALIAQAVVVPEPSLEACRRHFAAHAARYCVGERVLLRHILFAVTPGVDVSALRRRAESTLLDVRCHDGSAGVQGGAQGQDRFAAAARALSNCPSGEHGGDLGWLTREACVPEFAAEVLGHAEVGVLPRLVHSRFGLHVVEVLARDAGQAQRFDEVHGAVAMTLRQQAFITGLRQYLRVLAGQAVVDGLGGTVLDAADSPLVQ
jgi:peptidyl-prolyl cis-trans isomerase C